MGGKGGKVLYTLSTPVQRVLSVLMRWVRIVDRRYHLYVDWNFLAFADRRGLVFVDRFLHYPPILLPGHRGQVVVTQILK